MLHLSTGIVHEDHKLYAHIHVCSTRIRVPLQVSELHSLLPTTGTSRRAIELPALRVSRLYAANGEFIHVSDEPMVACIPLSLLSLTS